MFFRFGCAVVLVVSIALAGIALEKRNLQLRRALSRQHYRTETLAEVHARLRLRTEQLGAPPQTFQALSSSRLDLAGRHGPLGTGNALHREHH